MDIFFKNKRGVFLTIVLFLIAIGMVSSLFPDSTSVAPYMNLGFNPMVAYYGKLAIDIYLLGGIWLWKKSAFFGKLIVDTLTFIWVFVWSIHSNNLNTNATTLFVSLLIIYLFYDGLLLWAVKRQWKNFK